MTYSARIPGSSSSHKHCIGVSIADKVTGPYTKTSDKPFACPDPDTLGGAIDSAFFKDPDSGNLYIVYKVDGNSVGKQTPILLQQVGDDGFTPVGGTTQILVNGSGDGPLVEAPSLVKKDGLYVLFFSSNMYNTPLYDVSYATATAVGGPYAKSDKPLLVTGNGGLAAPGGASVTTDGSKIVFHANVGEVPNSPRGMWVGEIEIDSQARKVHI